MSRTTRERAFVLPLVIIMTVVATILIASVLERQGSQQRSLARQAAEYREQHFGKGVREVLDMWLRTQAGRSVRDMLAADGRAMDMELGDGTILRLYLSDVQGSILQDFSGLTGENLTDAAGALSNLTEAVPPSQRVRMVRPIGPAAVSVFTSPMEVLTAVARQVVGSQLADDCVRQLVELRDKAGASQQDLSEVAVALGLDDAQRRGLERMFAVEPTFFRVRLDAFASGVAAGPGPISRYEAYAIIPRPGQQRPSQANAVQRRTLILGWRKLEPR